MAKMVRTPLQVCNISFSKDRIHLSTRGNGALAKIIIGSIFYPRVVTNRLIVNDD